MAIEGRIKKMGQYKPPLEGRSEKDYLLLDFNERTTEPSKRVKEALKRFIDSGRLQVYPEYVDLEAKIAQYAGVKSGEVMVTNGGDQGIDIIMRAFLERGDKVIIPSPSFDMFYQSAGVQGAEILKPSYKNYNPTTTSSHSPMGEWVPGAFPLEEVLDLINENIKLIVICNPNNPTGTAVSRENILEILKKAKDADVAVLHDEAYFEFSRITCKDLIEKYDNLYIIRTFAKAFGLVSTRAGYIISQGRNIQELLKIRGPYDVNMFAKIGILAALEDIKYMEDYVKEVMEKSKSKLEKFLRKKEITFLPSGANFLLLKIKNPEKIFEGLKKQGILVRPKEWPDGNLAIRVTIGTLKDTEKFIKALDKVLTNL